MTASELPGWIVGDARRAPLPGFDPDGWWVMVVCTKNDRHPMEPVGVIYERTDYSESHRKDLVKIGELEPGDALPRDYRFNHIEWAAPTIALSSLDEEAKARVRTELGVTAESDPNLFHGRGSVNFSGCPHGCTQRIARTTWGTIMLGIWNEDPPRHWFDVSKMRH